jgi:RHS repeat-associated protein
VFTSVVDPLTGNRVAGVAIARYKYDALGRRILKRLLNPDGSTLLVTRFYYDGDRVVEERTGAQNLPSRQYIWGNYVDELLVNDTVDAFGNVVPTARLYALANSTYSVHALVNDTGAVVERYDYTPYGEVAIQNALGQVLPVSAVGNNYLFTGRELDAETGLFHFRARNYAPKLGRFIQRDPAGFTDGMNLYEYVRSRPTIHVDPSGKLDVFGNEPWDYAWIIVDGKPQGFLPIGPGRQQWLTEVERDRALAYYEQALDLELPGKKKYYDAAKALDAKTALPILVANRKLDEALESTRYVYSFGRDGFQRVFDIEEGTMDVLLGAPRNWLPDPPPPPKQPKMIWGVPVSKVVFNILFALSIPAGGSAGLGAGAGTWVAAGSHAIAKPALYAYIYGKAGEAGWTGDTDSFLENVIGAAGLGIGKGLGDWLAQRQKAIIVEKAVELTRRGVGPLQYDPTRQIFRLGTRNAAPINASGTPLEFGLPARPSELPGIRINPNKTWEQVEDQMTRIVRMRARQLGTQNAGVDPVDVNFERFQTDPFGFPRGYSGAAGNSARGDFTFDAGILAPGRILGAPRMQGLGLRSRMDVVFAHETTEFPIHQIVRSRNISHPVTVMDAPGTSLPIGQGAHDYLRFWSRFGPYMRGLP